MSSPLERARETAAAIAEPAGLPVEIDPALIEIDFGDWTGSRFEALHGSEAWRRYNAFRGTACSPGGEAMLDVQARAVAAMVRGREAHPGAELVLVSHADVIKAALAHFLGAPLDLFQRIADRARLAQPGAAGGRLGADRGDQSSAGPMNDGRSFARRSRDSRASGAPQSPSRSWR